MRHHKTNYRVFDGKEDIDRFLNFIRRCGFRTDRYAISGERGIESDHDYIHDDKSSPDSAGYVDHELNTLVFHHMRVGDNSRFRKVVEEYCLQAASAADSSPAQGNLEAQPSGE